MSDEYEEINKPKKKRSGPSMREQIAARRKAEAEAAGKGEAPAAKPMPRAAQKPAPKAAAKPAAPVRRAAAAKADDGDEAPAPRRRASGGASSRSSARRAGGSRSRRGKDDGDDEGGSTRGRRGRQEKKKSPMPMIAGVVVLAAIGGGAWFAMSGGGETEASETDGTETTETAEGTDVADTGTETPAEAPAADAAAEDAGTEAADAAAEEPADEPEAAPEPASEPNMENGVPTGIREGFDPNSTSTRKRSIEELMAMIAARAERPAFGKPEGVDDATWASAQEKAATMAGGGGRRVTQAGKDLAEMGKAGYAALANELIKLDYSNPEQFFNANAMTDAANAARGSDNPLGYGWRDSMTTEMPEGGDIRFNLKILVQIYDGWEKAVADPSYWESKLWLGDEYESDQKRAVENLEDEFGDISDDDFDFDN